MTTPRPYRSEIDALRERKESLQQELAKLREQTTQLESLRARESELAKELAGVEGALGREGTKRALPMLDDIKVASPCKAEWSEMLGDDRVRFCLSCEKNVYNLSSMTRADAEALLRERMGNELCVRFYQRADGTILTQDCPEGAKTKRRKKLAIAIAGAGAMAAATLTAFEKTTCATRTMGAVEPSFVTHGNATEVKGEVEPVMGQMPVVMGTATAIPVEPPPPPPPPPRVRMGKPTAR
ncbi:MAG: hypothetical protein KF819_25615 [Labilithrix sp.]|nr:hypothetical protein [Labilithrix sp.]